MLVLAWIGAIGAFVTIVWCLYYSLVDRPRNRETPESVAQTIKPLVYADRAGITGSGNVDVQLHNDSDHLATNITVELQQAGRLIGSKALPAIAGHEVPPRTDLMPPGTGSRFAPRGLEWTATCTYQGPDGMRWRSIRVSRPGNTGSTLDFEQADLHRPDSEAYGRVTNPDRYRQVVDAAKSLISTLMETYDVVQTVGTSEVDFPEWKGSSRDTIHLVPSQGVPLSFVYTDLPGVLVGFGSWGQETFPDCGCDACDEQPVEVARRMTELVETAIGGGYEEELTKRILRHAFVGQWGHSARQARLKRGEWRHHGQPGTHRWPQWPRR